MTFNEIAGLVGSLPASAWQQSSFWANDSHGQALAWRDAGWHVAIVDQRTEWVEFEPGTVGGTCHDNGRDPGGPRS